MLKIILILITFVFTLIFQSFGQSYKVEWGTLDKRSGSLISIIPRAKDDFFALRWSGGVLFGSLKLSKHTNLNLSATGKISMQVENSMAVYEGVTCVNNHLMVFLSDKSENKNKIYMQEYSENLEPKGKAVLLDEYEMSKRRFKRGFQIINSKDRQYFGVIWETFNKSDIRTNYGFHVFDKDLHTINKGNYYLNFEHEDSDIFSHHLSNTGAYFISSIEYDKTDEKNTFNKFSQYKSFHISHVTSQGLNDYVLDIQGKRVETITIESDNNHILTLTGVYGELNKIGINGIFYLKLDFNKQEIINKGFEEFKVDFITQDWTEKQKEKAKKKELNGKSGEPQLYDYKIRETNILPDGSLICSLEQYYVLSSSYRDPRTGSISTTNTYYYKDIITFKFGNEGKFIWINKINKQQVSMNDDSFSSYSSFIDNGKLCLIFNDNIKNYNEKGQFLDLDYLYTANFGKRKNAVGFVEVDLNTGEIKRKTLFNAKEIAALIVPKLFVTDYISKQLTLYAVYGKKEKFGSINFKD